MTNIFQYSNIFVTLCSRRPCFPKKNYVASRQLSDIDIFLPETILKDGFRCSFIIIFIGAISITDVIMIMIMMVNVKSPNVQSVTNGSTGQLHPSIKTLIMMMMTLKNTMTIAKSMMTMSAEKKIMADDDDASEVKPRMD